MFPATSMPSESEVGWMRIASTAIGPILEPSVVFLASFFSSQAIKVSRRRVAMQIFFIRRNYKEIFVKATEFDAINSKNLLFLSTKSIH
jgi:hypothetical protein